MNDSSYFSWSREERATGGPEWVDNLTPLARELFNPPIEPKVTPGLYTGGSEPLVSLVL